jgi:hypothetical protein
MYARPIRCAADENEVECWFTVYLYMEYIISLRWVSGNSLEVHDENKWNFQILHMSGRRAGVLTREAKLEFRHKLRLEI